MIAAVVNPSSANGKTGKEWSAIQSALESELGKINVFLTENQLHAVELTRQALKLGAKTVISVGGDGTLNEVVNGFFEAGKPLNNSAALAVVSRGTGADFVRSCAFPGTIHEIAYAIKTGTPQPCDVIRATLKPVDGALPERYVINVADVGVGGLVVNFVNGNSKYLGGTLSFFLASLRATLWEYKNVPLRIKLDGELISENIPHYFVAIANGRYFGGRMHVAPDAKLNDGLFDVVLVGDLTLAEKIRFATKLYRGKAEQLHKIHLLRGTRLQVTSDDIVFIEADGELVGTTNALFEIVPSAIKLIGLKNSLE
jgi:YegS/Rv2252/BmrU family lipid kinase